MEDVQISVVVPVYNTERYVRQCLESLLAQSFADFEVVCVDDGSTDTSASIVAAVARRDSRVRLHSQPNAGVSAARNAGISLARGAYVAFVDSDDTVAPDYLERLHGAARRTPADLIMSGITNVREGKTISKTDLRPATYRLTEEESLLALFHEKLLTSPVSKLYRRELITANALKFDVGLSFAEDKDFNLRYLACCETVASTDYNGYRYRRDVDGSLSKQFHAERYRVEYRHWAFRKGIFDRRGFDSLPTRRFHANQLFYILTDELAAISRSHDSVAAMLDTFAPSRRLIDANYLKANKELIDAPRWQKALLLPQHYRAYLLAAKHLWCSNSIRRLLYS